MKISIASDHAGFELKAFLVTELGARGFDMYDFGAHEMIAEDDYPIYISRVAKDISRYEQAILEGHQHTHTVHGIVATGRDHMGIIIGGSGQGEAIVANKYPHIRAAVVYGGVATGGSRQLIEEITTLSRKHNDANIISLGARFLSNEEALEMVMLWLETDFEGEERHRRRIGQINDIEKDQDQDRDQYED